MAKIYIECSASMASPFNTGIQRVVRNIVRESESVAHKLGIECVAVVFGGDGFFPYKQGNSNRSEIGFGRRLLRRGLLIAFQLDKGLRLSFLSLPYGAIRLILVRLLRRHVRKCCVRWGLCTQIAREQEKIVSGPSDVLLLADSTWNVDMWGSVDKFRAEGGHVCAVLYDLIPFTLPDTVEEHTRCAHTSWWLQVPLHVDSVMCISNSVRNQYLKWQEETELARKIPAENIGYFHLGAELKVCDQGAPSLLEIATSETPYFLVVGSVEPRKNHKTILDAFEILWQQGVEVNLLIVGGHGWKSEDFFLRVEQHPLLNKCLFLPRQVSDVELSCLYKATTALIIASFDEGFGLPIVEAYQRGAEVICSDIPVFHEVAGDRAAYFDPHRPESLAEAINFRIVSVQSNFECQPSRGNWLTWRESTEQLFERVLSMTASRE